MSSWFSNCLPKIADIQPHLKKEIQDLNKIKGVKEVYAWGSYACNINNPNYRVKDVDILAKTTFHSGDLLSINKNILKSSLTDEEFENQGYDPLSIFFSKKFISIENINIDPWAISSDKKLLHWGPIMADASDTQYVIKQAEQHANLEVGIDGKDLQKSSNPVRKNWHQKYCEYLKNCFEGMPSGWYQTDNIKMKDILEKVVKL